MQYVDAQIPVELISPNVTAHWRAKLRQNRSYKSVVNYELCFNQSLDAIKVDIKNGTSIVVALHRHGRKEMDYDNLVYAFKPIRDAIADLLLPGLAAGRADGDKRITWEYSQSAGKEYYIRISMRKEANCMQTIGPGEI